MGIADIYEEDRARGQLKEGTSEKKSLLRSHLSSYSNTAELRGPSATSKGEKSHRLNSEDGHTHTSAGNVALQDKHFLVFK